ncbi:hypothetical protein MKW94_026356 [Papaver nudicaule]|uniref:Uncharacterized protein n=1 Tax=Papaver nudicaule TaxID=74823 RepID=A0AA42AX36_PAPNU|nr:hypothetical protein [Papaver nudicaule]MCL7043633.1 hypothetical protein [Papaver nudicaule]
MVEIQVKDVEEKQQFLYECECSKQVEEIVRDVTEIYSLIVSKIHYLFSALLSSNNNVKLKVEVSVIRALSEAQAYASKDITPNQRPLSPHVLRDYIQTIEREVMKSQCMGFSDSNQLQKLYSDMELLREDAIKLQWAGKELLRNKRLCDYVGKNEKNKCTRAISILIKLERLNLDSASRSDKGFSYEKAS